VLISPYALIAVNRDAQNVEIDLTKKQIEDSPALKTDKPVSRQFEEKYYGYYRWPTYWRGSNPWGSYAFIIRDRDKWNQSNQGHKEWDHHLRSTLAVNDYKVQASDGELGHIDDFVLDDETWAIRYLIVNTGNWWSGKKVLISTQWIKRVSWSDSKVFVDLARESVKKSPEYTEDSALTRDYEIGLHQHYNRQGHWYDQLVDV
jgi:stress response protein YsnF